MDVLMLTVWIGSAFASVRVIGWVSDWWIERRDRLRRAQERRDGFMDLRRRARR